MKCLLTDRANVIDDYLSNSLSEKDKEKFEEHYFNCDDCYQDLKLKAEIMSLSQEEYQILFANYLEKRKTKQPDDFLSLIRKIPSINWNWQTRLASICISILVLVTVFIIVNIELSPRSQNEFYPIEPFPYSKPHTLGEVDEGKRLYYEGMTYYDSQDYKKASEKLEVALEKNPQLTHTHFYLGIAYLFQDKFDQAIKNLMIAVENSQNSEKEHWFLAHAYLRKGNIQKALIELQIVADLGQIIYSKKAIKLLENFE